jgi:very-short-patch-repair endonuclease
MAADGGREARTRRLLRAQQGAVHLGQLRAVGWTAAEIKTRVRRGEWQRRYRCVFIVGDPELVPLAGHSAALLSLGPRAVLSHRSAAALWSLTPAIPAAQIDVSVAAAAVRRRPDVRVHLVSGLDGKDIRTRDNLRVTSPARTAIDFAAVAPANELLHALSEAVAHGLTSEDELRDALGRVPANHVGAKVIRAILAEEPDLLRTRSTAERYLLPLVVAADLPRPLVNVWIHGELVDLYWHEQKLIVEIDGYQWHKSRQAFENDRRRDAKLVAAGYRVIRVTWAQITQQSHMVIARIAQALAVTSAA